MSSATVSNIKSNNGCEAVCPRLAQAVAKWTPSEGAHRTAIPGLDMFRADAPTACVSTIYEPCLCVIVQGRKQVQLGDRHIEYGPLSYMVSSVHLPVLGQVLEASPEVPYLSVKLDIEPEEVADLVTQLGDRLPMPPADARCDESSCGLCLAQIDMDLLDAVRRLLDLLDRPEDASVLAPLIRREIIYRALMGDMGARIRRFAMVDTQANRVSRVIDLLKDRFAEPLRVRDLAQQVNMSESSLFHSFKQVTRMSPLQYQKKLRLMEARRLMIGEGIEAATASYRVGYESPSQFSREYGRMFGAPPRADVNRLRGERLSMRASA